MDNTYWRSPLSTRKRRFWVHKIRSRHKSFDKLHDLLDDLFKDEEMFSRHFKMSSKTYKYILELIHTSIKKQNTNFLGELALRSSSS
jgi:translation initiation factor 2 alpha subunit (eIF-2alpha)